jgi:predicted transcriptional regulator
MKHQDLILGERRTFLQIWAQILEFCHQPRTKIQVMQTMGTSFKLTERYLLKLNKLRFLEEVSSRKKYATTDNGKKFLETWKQLVKMLNVEQPSKSRLKGKSTTRQISSAQQS